MHIKHHTAGEEPLQEFPLDLIPGPKALAKCLSSLQNMKHSCYFSWLTDKKEASRGGASPGLSKKTYRDPTTGKRTSLMQNRGIENTWLKLF